MHNRRLQVSNTASTVKGLLYFLMFRLSGHYGHLNRSDFELNMGVSFPYVQDKELMDEVSILKKYPLLSEDDKAKMVFNVEIFRAFISDFCNHVCDEIREELEPHIDTIQVLQWSRDSWGATIAFMDPQSNNCFNVALDNNLLDNHYQYKAEQLELLTALAKADKYFDKKNKKATK